MIKWTLLFCIIFIQLGLGSKGYSQRPNQRDTLAFSLSLTDSSRDDTVYLHATPPSKIIRFFNKNLRGIWHADTPVVGKAIIYFLVDREGKFARSWFDGAVSNQEIALETCRVADKMTQLPMLPTRVHGIPAISRVEVRVEFRTVEETATANRANANRADIVVIEYQLMR
jgi:hypothetical protein